MLGKRVLLPIYGSTCDGPTHQQVGKSERSAVDFNKKGVAGANDHWGKKGGYVEFDQRSKSSFLNN